MRHALYILFTIIILVFSGCKKDDVRVKEFKITSESVYKNTSTIVITVNYNYISVLQSVDGYISDRDNMTDALHVHGVINNNTFVLTFNDLHANTTYYYYYAYSNGIDHLTESEIKVATTNDYGLPTVITNDVTDITATSAICGGEITDDGEGKITARGVCYSLNENPTIDDSHTIDSLGIGSFTSHLFDLINDTIYYVRAYATNEAGIQYGTQISFKTYINAPEGSVNGLFSISDTQKAYFSRGNLQYQASTNTWRFATNQYDYIGQDNSQISPNYNGWIDLFGWGTGDDPTNINNNNYTFNDWGNNSIINGGNTIQIWHTLTHDEWFYLFNTRKTKSGIRFVKAIVNNVKGIILLPDYWNNSYYTLYSINVGNVDFNCNIIPLNVWIDIFEDNGATFLSAAGCRHGSVVQDDGSIGYYWASSRAHEVFFLDSYINLSTTTSISYGQSVRLVYDAE